MWFGLNHLEIGLIYRQIISWPVGRPSNSQIGFETTDIDMQYSLIILDLIFFYESQNVLNSNDTKPTLGNAPNNDVLKNLS